MANKRVKRYETKVYNRKILRNMIKKLLNTNKIKKAWHELGE